MPESNQHQQARRQVDLKDPRPAVIVGEITADGRPDRRREGGADGEPGETDRSLAGRQHGHDDREGERDEDVGDEALQRAEDDHLAEAVRLGAQHEEQQEERGVGQQIAP
jgi:hypothetical protein